MEINVAAREASVTEDTIKDEKIETAVENGAEDQTKKSLAIVPDQKKPSVKKTEKDILETLIEKLPENFSAAEVIIQNEIAPILLTCSPGVKDHYIKVIKNKTGAASIKSVSLVIDEAKERMNAEETSPDVDNTPETPPDSEVQAMANQIAMDPALLKTRIDLVNQLGVIGERKNIGLYMIAMDSCLLPMGVAGSEALALKNSGHYGAGKSYPLFMCLKLYPKTAYHLISSGSDKSLYNMDNTLKHRVLILAEALALESSGKGDNELAYAIRTLISEGHLKYQYTGFKDKNRITLFKKSEGPTSLLTTTVKGKLEDQLDDRMITIHPNTTFEQTHEIHERSADLAAGNIETVDDKIIKAWKLFRQSLNPVKVVVPFAPDIIAFVNRKGALPISARRAFNRVLSAVKTITLLYQKQRRIDAQGRFESVYMDYAMAFQLIHESFRESLGEAKIYTDKRIQLIEKKGAITPKELSEMTGVSVSAISQWLKPLIEKGILNWCDENGDEFEDSTVLEKAKRTGKAFIVVAGFNCLPTPYQLTGDERWNKGGDLYEQYNLELDDDYNENVVFEGNDLLSYETPAPVPLCDLFDSENTDKSDMGVKVLSEKSDPENKNIATITEEQPDVDADDILKELQGILLTDKKLGASHKSNGNRHNLEQLGILPI